MKNPKIKQHLLALGVFAIALIIFCLPAIKGKILSSHDFISWQYMSHEAETVYNETGESIYWSNSQFGGMPSYTFYGGNGGNIIANFLFGANNGLPRPFIMMIMSMLSFYVLTCAFAWRIGVRIFSSVAFAFAYSPMLAYAGHDTKVLAIAFAAGLLGSILFVLRGKKWLGLGLTTLFSALLFTSGHYQIVYYSFILYAIIIAVEMYTAFVTNSIPALLKNIVLIAMFGAIGILPTLKSVLLIQDYTKYTMRGGESALTINKDPKAPKKSGGLDRDYAFRWSNGIGETFAMLIPGLYGPMSNDKREYVDGATIEKINEVGIPNNVANQILTNIPNYWGPQPFIMGPVYFGAIVIFLLILSLFVVQSNYKIWLAIASIFFIVLSLGGNLPSINNWLFAHMPMYNKFRAPSMALAIPQILFPLFAGWALHEIFISTQESKYLLKKLLIATGITAGIVLLFGFGASFTQDATGATDDLVKESLNKALGDASKVNAIYNGVKEDRFHFITKDSMHSLIFVLLGAAFIFLTIKKTISSTIAWVGITILTFADVTLISNRYAPEEQFYIDKDVHEAENFSPRAVDNQILQDKDPFYRVQDLSVNTYNDAKPAYFHKLVGGYSPTKMESYQDLIDVQLNKNNKEVYNMLNTKYFIVPNGQQGGAAVMPNKDACGNAWFVNNIKMVNNADEEMLALNAPSLSDSSMRGDFVAKNTAIVAKSFAANIPVTTFIKDSSATIKLDKYGLQEMLYSSKNTQAGFAVFSDIYYDGGWKAYVDDKETPIVKANYVLRAINIPAGSHKIKFEFNPPKAKALHTLAFISSSFVILCFIGLLYWGWKKGEFLQQEQ
jgi:Bacterial membrane protein YfhO